MELFSHYHLSLHSHEKEPQSSAKSSALTVVGLLKQSTVVFIILFITYVFSFIFNVILANWLGYKEFGIVNLIFRFFAVIVPIMAFGVDGLLIKNLQVYIIKSDYPKLLGILNWSLRVFCICTVAYCIISVFLLFNFNKLPFGHGVDEELDIFLKSVWLPPLLTFMYIESALLRSLKKFYLSTFLSWSCVLVFNSIILIIWHYQFKKISMDIVFAATGIAVVFSIILQGIFAYINLPEKNFHLTPIYLKMQWLTYSTYIMFSNMLSTTSMFVTLLILDIFYPQRNLIADFSVCFVIANVFIMITQAVALLIGPRVHILQKENRFDTLQWEINVINRFKLFVGFIFLIIVFMFGHTILAWFGHNYYHLYIPLIVLSLMYFFSIYLGTSPSILQYAGYSKKLDALRLLQLILLIIFSLVLTYYFDLMGAIVSNGLSLMIFEVMSSWQVKKNIRLSTFSL